MQPSLLAISRTQRADPINCEDPLPSGGGRDDQERVGVRLLLSVRIGARVAALAQSECPLLAQSGH